MSISGKCDFSDTVEFYGADKILNNYKIYAAHNDVIPLKFEKPADLIAYYPYIVGMMCGSKDGYGIIHLSERSYIDIEEEENMKWRLDTVKRIWRRCKRKKVPFDRAAAEKALCTFREPLSNYKKEIIDRVENLGDKATIEDIHDEWHDRMRKEWYELMVTNGWDEVTAYRWVFGWKRYLTRAVETMESVDEPEV